ncbi:DNA polymerase epsilon [Operophtera brumata]|uniref:DNA polymerase epsilon catalytic subunit n=1 Tax=Operophtera brumata TaxID=104452 RepID=A0A0L7K938_OPEBR|nr:DNA polymerase epsilon [Operophtera brumata]
MIASWLRDVTQFKNVFADYQISHFYRRTLYNLMKRLFLMLVAEFKRLGSVIVIRGVRGAKHQKQGAVPRNRHPVQAMLGVPAEGSVSMQWNLANFLPGAVKEQFAASEMRAQPGLRADALAGDVTPALLYVNAVCKVLSLDTALDEEVRAKGTVTLSRSTQLVKASEVRGQPGLRADVLVGDVTPALLYVNSVCKVLSLDTALDEKVRAKGTVTLSRSTQLVKASEVRGQPGLRADVLVGDVTLLRRNLLRLIGVGEFSSKAEWREPCNTCVLSEVICKVCNHCRDLDLCRDTRGTLDNWREPCNTCVLSEVICKVCNHCRDLDLCRDTRGTLDNIRTQLTTFKTIAEYYKMPLLQELIHFNQDHM